MKQIDGHAMIARVRGLMESGAVDMAYFNAVKEAVQMEPEYRHSGCWKRAAPNVIECSECRALLSKTRIRDEDGRDVYVYLLPAYCPSCGARMDAGAPVRCPDCDREGGDHGKG